MLDNETKWWEHNHETTMAEKYILKGLVSFKAYATPETNVYTQYAILQKKHIFIIFQFVKNLTKYKQDYTIKILP